MISLVEVVSVRGSTLLIFFLIENLYFFLALFFFSTLIGPVSQQSGVFLLFWVLVVNPTNAQGFMIPPALGD